MAGQSSFPIALDTFARPSADTLENASGFEHDLLHNQKADAIEKLQAKIGINGSQVAQTLDFRISSLEASMGLGSTVTSFIMQSDVGTKHRIELRGSSDACYLYIDPTPITGANSISSFSMIAGDGSKQTVTIAKVSEGVYRFDFQPAP